MLTSLVRVCALACLTGFPVVQAAGSSPSAVALVALPSPSVYGRPVSLTAMVTPSSAAGFVTFYDGVNILGAGTVNAGQARLTTTSLGTGVHTLFARYNGDLENAPSLSPTARQTVTSVAANAFAPAVSVTTTIKVSDGLPVAADFNGDGNMDLAVTDADGNGDVAVLLGDGHGSFTQVQGAVLPAGDYGLAAGDFNNDGKMDLAAVNSAAGEVLILLGRGDGTFEEAISTPTGAQQYSLTNLVVADFNGDGNADIAVASYVDNDVIILLGNGNGGFQSVVRVPTAGGVVTHSGDFNGDGKTDLAVGSQVFLGNGDGTFQPPVAVPLSGIFAFAVGDLNGDGKADLAAIVEVSPASNSKVFALLGNGDGTFQQPVDTGAWSFVGSVAIVDFNGDGIPDLITDGQTLLGKGDGTFLPPEVNASTSWSAIADFNGDGRVDLAFGSNVNSVEFLFGAALAPATVTLTSSPNPAGILQPVTLTATVSPSAATGIVDFIIDQTLYAHANLNAGTAQLTIAAPELDPLYAIGTHTLEAAYGGDSVYAPATSPVVQQQMAKYVTPAVTLSSSPNPSSAGQSIVLTVTVSPVLQGNLLEEPPTFASGTVTFMDGSAVLGTATLTEAIASFTVTTLSPGAHLLTAMYSGDGVFYPASSNSVEQTVNASTATETTLVSSVNPVRFGQIVALTATVTPATATGTVSFLDDVTVLETEPLVNGEATLKTGLLASGVHPIHAFYPGDNADAPSTSAIVVQRVSPVETTGFAPPQTVSGLTSAALVTTGDFNGDGKTDLLVTGQGGPYGVTYVLIGNGDGTFEQPILSPISSAPVVVGDFNGDGKPDLAGIQDGGYVEIALGNGDGTFRAASGATACIPTIAPCGFFIATADFNGDGKADVVVTVIAGAETLLGNGDGSFRPPSAIATGLAPGAIVVGDFNGDGKPDLLFADGYTFPAGLSTAPQGASISVVIGNGDGTFQSPAIYSEGAAPTSIAIGDFNGDGKTDIVVGLPANNFDIFLGNGDGTFQPVAHVPTPMPVKSIAVADLNGDGKLDVVFPWGYELGNGDGTFQAAVQFGVTGTSVAVADFNRDGRADVVVAGPNGLVVLLGAPRSLGHPVERRIVR